MSYKIGENRYKKIAILGNDQILAELGRRFEAYRLEAGFPDREIMTQGGIKNDALANFKKGRNISFLNFIKLLRGAKLLHRLEDLIPAETEFSPMAAIQNQKRQKRQRIRKAPEKATDFKWGDE
jgi:hypothetical protein